MVKKFLILIFFSIHFYSAYAQLRATVNVKDYGAVGDGKTDDTQAFRNAIDYLKTVPQFRTLYIPSGIYLLSKKSDPKEFWAIKLIDSLKLIGEIKERTILRLNANTTALTRIAYLQNIKDVDVENLSFDGNSNNIKLLKGVSSQMHAISINSSINIYFKNCAVMNTYGDGIGINGPENPSRNIHIANCSFNHHLRNGITLGSGFIDVSIDSSTFENVKVQPIDTEPQSGECSDVSIKDNIIYGDSLNKNIITLGGYNLRTGTNIKVTGNKLFNCGIQLVNSRDVTLSNNHIYYDTLFKGKTKAIIYLLRYNKNIIISSNKISTENIPVLLIIGVQGNLPDNIKFVKNLIYTNSYIPVFFASTNMQNIEFSENLVQSSLKNDLLFSISNQSAASKISFFANKIFNVANLFEIKNNYKILRSTLSVKNNNTNNANFFKNIKNNQRPSTMTGYQITY